MSVMMSLVLRPVAAIGRMVRIKKQVYCFPLQLSYNSLVEKVYLIVTGRGGFIPRDCLSRRSNFGDKNPPRQWFDGGQK